MKSLLKEKDNIHRGMKVEIDYLKQDLRSKSDEIARLKASLSEARGVYDDDVMSQLQQVDEIIAKKDRENVLLRKRCEELRQTLKEIKENPGENFEDSMIVRNQNEMIANLKRQIDQIQTESFVKESQLQLDEDKLTKKEQYIQLLKQEANCSRSIVHDLIKLLKFKEFQAGRLQQIYEDKVESGKVDELNAVLNKLKPQEGPLRSR